MLSLILPLQSFLSSLLVYLYPPVWAKSVNRILNTHTPTNTWRVYSLVHGLYATIFLSSSWVFQLEIISCSFKFCNTFAITVAGCEHSNLHWMDKKMNGDCIWREDCSSCVPIPQRDTLERWLLAHCVGGGFWLMCFSNMIPLCVIFLELLCVTWDNLQLHRSLQLTLECHLGLTRWQRRVITAS